MLHGQAAFTDKAKSSLLHFLRLRATETVPGGALVAHIPIVSSDPVLTKQSWHMHVMNEVIMVRRWIEIAIFKTVS